MTDNASKSLQEQYDSLLKEASGVASAIQRLSTEIEGINRDVPELSEKLQEILERSHEFGIDYNPDNPVAPEDWFFDDEMPISMQPINIAPSLTEIETEANRQIRTYQKEIQAPQVEMRRIKERFQEIVIAARRDKPPLKRDQRNEARFGLVAASEAGSITPEADTSIPDISQPRRPGRQKDPNTEKRNQIVCKHMKTRSDFKNMQKVESLFQELDDQGVPLPQSNRPPRGWNPKKWKELLTRPKSPNLNRNIETLRRSMFPRKRRALGTK